MSTVERTVTVASAADLEALAARVAGGLAPGDRVALRGDLGAGKTTFVRGLARGLGHPEPRDVVSPTFAIHNRYEGGRIVLDHVDLYRLVAPVRLEREGLEPVFAESGTVVCCEWPERLGGPLAGLALEVEIDFLPGEEGRRVTLRAAGACAARYLGPL